MHKVWQLPAREYAALGGGRSHGMQMSSVLAKNVMTALLFTHEPKLPFPQSDGLHTTHVSFSAKGLTAPNLQILVQGTKLLHLS